MVFEPGFGFFHTGGAGADDVPEAGGVVALQQVGEFVDDDVVNDVRGRLDEAPIESDGVLGGARAPTVAEVGDPGGGVNACFNSATEVP